jgi:ketosteroid isomerase-like protein
MKRNFLFPFIAIIAMAACHHTHPSAAVDIEAEEAAVNDLIDQVHSAMEARDAATLVSYFTEDMLSCGSDPAEFWNKQQTTELWTQMLADTALEINVFGDRLIKVTPDGHSAIAVEQYFIPMFTPNMPFRIVYHLVKTGDQWMISFFSTALIPKNEDLAKLSEALD